MDTDSRAQTFYAGEFRHSIDEKNRITIPSPWRGNMGQDFILLPEPSLQFLLVMSPHESHRRLPSSWNQQSQEDDMPAIDQLSQGTRWGCDPIPVACPCCEAVLYECNRSARLIVPPGTGSRQR